ncbi:MAG: sensor histidine kinase, partial [Candidatus Sericytochromatia bacterium]
ARRLRELNQEAIVFSQTREDRYMLLTEVLAALAVGLGVLLAGLTWWRSSRDIVQPLLAIESGMAALAAGGQPLVHHPRSGMTRELESLEAGFNRLVASLGEAKADLREANETLEAQVADRTEALSSANARLERNVEELRAVDAVKSRFMTVVSHELLTPINFITGYGSALEDELMGPLQEGQHKAVRRMLEGAQRLTRLVRNAIEATQLESGELAIAPVSAPVEPVTAAAVAAMRPLAETKGQLLEVAVPADLPDVLADPERLEQVLVELLDNAIKFTAEGGKVRLTASPREGGLVLSVSDTGVGIAPEALPSLFDRFYQEDSSRTRRHGGLGLGLSISRSLVEGMNGRLEVHSRLGEGTTVIVTLPLAAAAEGERHLGRVE